MTRECDNGFLSSSKREQIGQAEMEEGTPSGANMSSQLVHAAGNSPPLGIPQKHRKKSHHSEKASGHKDKPEVAAILRGGFWWAFQQSCLHFQYYACQFPDGRHASGAADPWSHAASSGGVQ